MLLATALLLTPTHCQQTEWSPLSADDLAGIVLLESEANTAPKAIPKGSEHELFINITFLDGEPLDVNIVLDVMRGDADLHVLGPIADPAAEVPATEYPGIERISAHHTGTETIFLSRDDILSAGMGIYRVGVVGYAADNEYSLSIERTSTERRPPPEEQKALEDIYSQCCGYDDSCFALENYVEASGRSSPDNFCHAPFQACDKDGHILVLRLPAQELECKLPASLGNLTHLQRLDLEENYIFGEASEFFSLLENMPLQSLHIGFNYLNGKLPCLPTEEDKPLSNLAFIDMRTNRIDGEIEGCFFTAAQEIVTLRANLLTGTVPGSVPEAPKLRHVDLSWQDEENLMTGQLPDLSVWPSLEYLDVSQNNISGTIPVLPSSLNRLWLHDNHIDGSIPEDLGALGSLQVFDAENNKLSGSLPKTIPEVLEVLNVGRNGLTGSIPGASWFGDNGPAMALRDLRLDENKLTGPLPPEVGQFKELWLVLLEGNSLDGTLEAFVGALEDENQLVQLRLGKNDLTGPIPEGISKLHGLQDGYGSFSLKGGADAVVDLSDNRLTGPIPKVLLLAAADDGLSLEVNGNELECPQEYLGIFPPVAPESPRRGELFAVECIDLAGETVPLSVDQGKRRPSNLIWDEDLEDWVTVEEYDDYSDPEGDFSSYDGSESGADNSGWLLLEPGIHTQPLELFQGDEHFYHVNLTFPENEPFDMSLVLDAIRGDADLHVLGPIADPSGDATTVYPSIEKKSAHHTGTEIVFLSRDDILDAGMGIYRIVVKGYAADNEYSLSIERTSTERRPPPEEQKALEDIYSQCCSYIGSCLDLAPYVEAAGRSSPDNFCHAPFQACDKDGHILVLRLPAQELECKLPASLGNLTHLQRLDLEENYIFGEASEFFSLLENMPLQSLHIGFNYLNGKLPCLPTEEDKPLSSLAFIDMRLNRIDGEIEGCFFTAAQEIVTLRANLLTGTMPGSVPEAPKLRHVDLSWQDEENLMTGQLPDLSVWPSLEYLDVSQNNISGTIPVLPSSIRTLWLHDNHFDGSIPEDLGALGSLQVFDAENNQLSGSLPNMIPKKLEVLNVGRNGLTGSIPGASWFGGDGVPTGLRQLQLDQNKLTGTLPAEAGKLKELAVLNLESNSLDGTLEAFVGSLEDENQLVKLRLGKNDLTGPIPEGIGKLQSLQDQYEALSSEGGAEAVVDLSDNHLTGPIPKVLLLAAAEEELRLDINGNELECPQEYLDVFDGLEQGSGGDQGLAGVKCIDREGNYVLLQDDQAKLSQSQTPLKPPAPPPAPTASPTASPTDPPTQQPTSAPTTAATPSPSSGPTASPTSEPSIPPTPSQPTSTPTSPSSPQSGDRNGDLMAGDGDFIPVVDSGAPVADAAPALESSGGGLSSGTIIIIATATAFSVIAVSVAVIGGVFMYRRRTGQAYRDADLPSPMATHMGMNGNYGNDAYDLEFATLGGSDAEPATTIMEPHYEPPRPGL